MRKNIRKAAAFAAVFFCIFGLIGVPAAAQDAGSIILLDENEVRELRETFHLG